jgi:hypothetical protein
MLILNTIFNGILIIKLSSGARLFRRMIWGTYILFFTTFSQIFLDENYETGEGTIL